MTIRIRKGRSSEVIKIKCVVCALPPYVAAAATEMGVGGERVVQGAYLLACTVACELALAARYRSQSPGVILTSLHGQKETLCVQMRSFFFFWRLGEKKQTDKQPSSPPPLKSLKVRRQIQMSTPFLSVCFSLTPKGLRWKGFFFSFFSPLCPS